MKRAKKNSSKTLMLEDYMGFFDNHDPGPMHMEQLKEVLSMHGRCMQKVKGGVMQELRSVDMMSPRRSTLGDGAGVGPSAPLTLAEVKDDIRSIGWEECPVGSILAFGTAAKAPGRARKQKSLSELISATPAGASAAATSKRKKVKAVS